VRRLAAAFLREACFARGPAEAKGGKPIARKRRQAAALHTFSRAA